LKYCGVVYDVGLRFSGTNKLSLTHFDPAQAEYDMRAFARDMHATAVRIEGEDIERLVVASRAAHRAGLSVWFSPWKMDVGLEENRIYIAEAARAAEQLRQEGADIIFVTACEYTIFNDGIYPGSSVLERSAWAYGKLDNKGWPYTPVGLPEPFPSKAKELNKVLAELAGIVRKLFKGRQTYSAAIFEEVDWTPFDFVGTNYYRERQTDAEYIAGLDYFRSFGKPVAIMEYGCCSYRGAAIRGSRGWRIFQGVEADGMPKWEGGVIPTRNEREQADYIERQFKVFTGQGVEAAFIFIFTQPGWPTGEGVNDRDLAGFGIAKIFPDDDPRSRKVPNWEPKEAFHRAAELFRKHAAGSAGVGRPAAG
jgi:hypothetical protein